MSGEFRPRPHDHVVEPIFGALRDAPAEDAVCAADAPTPPAVGRRGAVLRWALLVLGLVALAWLLSDAAR